MRKDNKYAFNSSYYKRSYVNAVEGSNARRLNAVPEYEEEEEYEVREEEYSEEAFDEDYAEEDFRGYEEEKVYVNRNDVEAVRGKKVKYKRSYRLNPGAIIVVAISVVALLYAAASYIRMESQLNLMDKQIKTTSMELADVQAKNASLTSMLDKEIDRNYLYTVAVSQLGMTYPDKNSVIPYQIPDNGYVKQFGAIPSK